MDRGHHRAGIAVEKFLRGIIADFVHGAADDIVDISRLALARRDDVRYVYDSVWQYLASGEHLDRRICNRRKASAYERLWYIAV